MQTPTKLTADEIALCERFGEFLIALNKRTGIKNITVSQHRAVGGFFSASVQDAYRAFSCGYSAGQSLADRLQGAVDAFAAANPPEKTEEERAKERAAELRAELARIEAEQSA